MLWTAAVAAELLVLRPALFDRDAPVQGLEVVFACVGGSFAACGLVAWRRRPDSRSGALMTATGFAFFLPALFGQIDAPLAATLVTWWVDLWSVLFVALLLSLLTAGRLESMVDKLLVFAFVLPLLILNFVWLLFAEEVEPNLLLAFPDEQIADVIDTDPAVDPARRLPRHGAGARPPLAGGDAAAAARAAADDRGLVRPADLQRAAHQRPRVRRALAELLCGSPPARS